MFDPEKVERFLIWDIVQEDCVTASDYDQLLRLHREEKRALEWAKTAVGVETFETLMMAAKAEINVAYECGDYESGARAIKE